MKTTHFFKKAAGPIVIMSLFIWIGFVCAISFMEAWLKFRAPNVSLSIGLGIGQLVFAALNKVEWALAFLITIFTLIGKHRLSYTKFLNFSILILILATQSFVWLPILNERADFISRGLTVPFSAVHLYYVFFEITKVIFLFIIGTKALLDLRIGK